MKVEEGKWYQSAYGYKVGPMKPTPKGTDHRFPWCADGHDFYYMSDGTAGTGVFKEHNLVLETQEGPVRTVIRREVVLGEYSGVTVTRGSGEKLIISFHEVSPGADFLRSAAMILSQIAETFDDKETTK